MDGSSTVHRITVNVLLPEGSIGELCPPTTGIRLLTPHNSIVA
jgi:hypothetical protein